MTSRTNRWFGAVLGSCGGLSAGYGATWSGLGDDGPHVWLIAIGVGALLGAFSWQPLQNPGDSSKPHWFYAGLFGGAAGLIAGAFASYPFGALFGGPGGAVGAACACVGLNKLYPRTERRLAVGMAVGGGLVGLLVVAGLSP